LGARKRLKPGCERGQKPPKQLPGRFPLGTLVSAIGGIGFPHTLGRFNHRGKPIMGGPKRRFSDINTGKQNFYNMRSHSFKGGKTGLPVHIKSNIKGDRVYTDKLFSGRYHTLGEEQGKIKRP